MPDERLMGRDRETELILPLGVFAFVLDETKGHVNTLPGPIKQSLSNTDRLVTYNAETGRFIPAANQEAAKQTNVRVPKGHYVILENPAKTGKQPEPGKAEVMVVDSLKMGQIENLPGPQYFPLWPGQNATVVLGHHLRSNQYLLGRVYDDEAAKQNWDKSVVKGATADTTDVKGAPIDPQPAAKNSNNSNKALGIDKESLVTGQLLVIAGTSVAFYIPPTGIEVLQDENNEYVRDAVTLERLEYSILLDESGNKSYVIGPKVVFPTPTQTFVTKDGKRKFRAFELQPTTGIHVKVIADYEEEVQQPLEDGTDKPTTINRKAGDELFITGADMPIYYPRQEHAIISYGGQEKSFAVAIPDGEGRYVLDRTTGVIDLVEGPKMFLPNPINQVIVQRALTDAECQLWFPGNEDVLRINRERAERDTDDFNGTMMAASSNYAAADFLESSGEAVRGLRSATLGASPRRERAGKGAFGDAMNRGTTYTPPRTITLNTKYDGAVGIEPWSGHAVQVVNSKGQRRTILGPAKILLRYDETLARLSLSKGKPKNSDTRLNTVYLRYDTNPVSDILSLKTQDLVNVDIAVKYLVRFDAAKKDRWFAMDNYVQYMVDHLRSLIGNTVRNIGVQEFYQNATNILRDIVLGKKTDLVTIRPLHNFEENGMTVYDLELINVTVKDGTVAELLSNARQQALKDSIELERAQEKLVVIRGQEATKRDIADELATTQQLTDRLNAEQVARAAANTLAIAENETQVILKRKEGERQAAEIAGATAALYLETDKEKKDLEQVYEEAKLVRTVTTLVEEAKSSKVKMEAVTPGLVEALIATANAGILEKVTPQLAALGFIHGQDLETLMASLLKGTGGEAILDNLKSLTTRARTATR